MKEVLPNFLIAGMAKCGTSSLSQYLKSHPDVFISKKKEPRFLSSQCMRFPMNGPKDRQVENWYVKDFDSYKELFAKATEKAIGEASADTLYFHEGTIPVIKQYLGDPHILIIIRDPVKRAFSAYQHMVRDEREMGTFEEGLEGENQRIVDNWELIYHYRKASQYYAPIKAFMENFSNVKILLNEDLQSEPNRVLKEVFEFLGVDPDVPIDTDLEFNRSGKPKSQALHDNLQSESTFRKIIRPFMRVVLPTKKLRIRAFTWLSTKNLDRLELSQTTASALRKEFREEMIKTGDLIGMDLNRYQ